MMRARLRVLMASTIACCGCASAPVSYYTLVPPAASPDAQTASACCVVEIRNVRIPPQVDRPELVIRRSAEQFDILSNDLWISPLRDEIREALLNDIRAKIPARQAGPAERARKVVLWVDVSRFESEPARYALIETEWRVERAEDAKSASPVCKTVAEVPITGGVPGLVRGYQQAISTVASSITSKLLDAQQGAALECPTPQPPG